MKRYLYIHFLFQTMLFAVMLPGESFAQEPYQIKSIKAFFYFHEAGNFGVDDLITTRQILWNSIIGEGATGNRPSSTTLVLVEISGPGFVSGTKGRVELRASTPNGTLLNQTIPFSTLFTEQHKIVLPFMVFGTGCERLHLVATVVTQNNKKLTRSADVNFACGE